MRSLSGAPPDTHTRTEPPSAAGKSAIEPAATAAAIRSKNAGTPRITVGEVVRQASSTRRRSPTTASAPPRTSAV